MAGNFSKYISDQVINWVKGTAFAGAPANLYVALFTTMPAYDGTGAVEVSGGAISNGANGDQVSNSADASFPTPTAGWGTVLGYGLYDASSAGNLIAFNTLTGGSKVINSGDTPVKFAAGALVFASD